MQNRNFKIELSLFLRRRFSCSKCINVLEQNYFRTDIYSTVRQTSNHEHWPNPTPYQPPHLHSLASRHQRNAAPPSFCQDCGSRPLWLTSMLRAHRSDIAGSKKSCTRTRLPHSPQSSETEQPACLHASLHALYMMRQSQNFKKRGETSKKMYLISFFIATLTNSFSVPSMNIMGMPACLYLAYPPCSKFKALQHKREMKKNSENLCF